MAPNASQLSALTRLFSSAVFRDMSKNGSSALFARLIGQTGILSECADNATVGDAFNSSFAVLKTAGLRDEYIYRAALTQKILMGKHSLRTASMLNEFRAGTCKADLVILNGTATVYEIKSERDSLTRLENQVDNYRKIFAAVNVITSESHIDRVQKTVPQEVGIMCLSRRYQISIVREPVAATDQICATTVFESLRTAEAAAILKKFDIDLPKVPNTKLRATMRERFANLPPADLHREMVQVLKRTRNLASLGDLVQRLPQSLHAAALSIPVRRCDHDRLVEAVETPIDTAIAWG